VPTLMEQEIGQQPDIVRRLAASPEQITAAVDVARRARVKFVLYASRGSSDNAAVYGKYLSTIMAGLPTGLAVPSAVTVYRATLDLRDCLVIGISQSGETPDVVQFMQAASAAGALTIAVTNEANSSLASACRLVIATQAGVEQSVAATKTYTSQLAALALFWSEWSGLSRLVTSLREDVPQAMAEVMTVRPEVQRLATWLRFSERLLLVARGYTYSTALEAALKLKETSHMNAAPYSAADLMHGPVAAVESACPALLFEVGGPALATMRSVARDLVARGAELVHIGEQSAPAEHRDIAPASLPRRLILPPGVPEELSPLVAVIPAQLLALELALVKGLDPDRPLGLSKITRTL
jgi:glutamine---fructose-6-phosphate transaminase (isomerizing)